MTTGDFENAMATHFWGPLHLMFKSFRRCGGAASAGSSTSPRLADGSPALDLAPGCASKFALVGLSEARPNRTRC